MIIPLTKKATNGRQIVRGNNAYPDGKWEFSDESEQAVQTGRVIANRGKTEAPIVPFSPIGK